MGVRTPRKFYDEMVARISLRSFPMKSALPRQTQAGFSLTELIVVIAIIGILASVAVTSFRTYRARIRVGEAFSMLGLIKVAEEGRKSLYGRYVAVPPHPTANPPNGVSNPWVNGAMGAWTLLDVEVPDDTVYYVYDVSTGTPNDVPSTPDGPVPWVPPPRDQWWAARARGDIDGDGRFSLFELCSECKQVWVSQGELGYEYEGR